jgi:hypothetical protein
LQNSKADSWSPAFTLNDFLFPSYLGPVHILAFDDVILDSRITVKIRCKSTSHIYSFI